MRVCPISQKTSNFKCSEKIKSKIFLKLFSLSLTSLFQNSTLRIFFPDNQKKFRCKNGTFLKNFAANIHTNYNCNLSGHIRIFTMNFPSEFVRTFYNCILNDASGFFVLLDLPSGCVRIFFTTVTVRCVRIFYDDIRIRTNPDFFTIVAGRFIRTPTTVFTSSGTESSRTIKKYSYFNSNSNSNSYWSGRPDFPDVPDDSDDYNCSGDDESYFTSMIRPRFRPDGLNPIRTHIKLRTLGRHQL